METRFEISNIIWIFVISQNKNAVELTILSNDIGLFCYTIPFV